MARTTTSRRKFSQVLLSLYFRIGVCVCVEVFFVVCKLNYLIELYFFISAAQIYFFRIPPVSHIRWSKEKSCCNIAASPIRSGIKNIAACWGVFVLCNVKGICWRWRILIRRCPFSLGGDITKWNKMLKCRWIYWEYCLIGL